MKPATTIDGYLDELFGELRGDPGQARRVVAECEDHLRELAATCVAGADAS